MGGGDEGHPGVQLWMLLFDVDAVGFVAAAAGVAVVTVLVESALVSGLDGAAIAAALSAIAFL